MGKKRKRRRSSRGSSWLHWRKDDRVIKIAGLVAILLAIYLSIAFISYLYTWRIDQDKVLRFSWGILLESDLSVANWLGRLGAVVSNLFFYWGFGLPSLFIIAILFRLGFNWIRRRPLSEFYQWAQNIALITLFCSIFLEFVFASSAFPWGGAFGESSCTWLTNFIGTIGLGILLTFSVISFVVWTFNPDFEKFEYALAGIKPDIQFPNNPFEKINISLPFISSKTASASDETDPKKESPEDDEWQDDLSIYDKPEKSTDTSRSAGSEASEHQPVEPQIPPSESSDTELEINVQSESKESEQSDGSVSMDPVLHIKEENRNHTEPYDPKADLRNYKMPDLKLLRDYETKLQIDREELESNKDQIINTLKHYNIEITKIRATVGPTVTLYEIVPAPGIRISKIKNLEDDIALSLAALGIRIIAPIPGKGTIGIEVPNKKRQVVALKDIIRSEKFQNAKMDLPIALGKTISNEPFVADLAKMPHLLVAGATGQGKSVGINAILMSILYKKHPSQVKFVLVDPKKVELPIYNEISQHYLASLPDQEEPIITDTQQVVHTLNSLCIEMDERYDLLKMARARNIKEYNEKFTKRKLNPNKGHRFLPFIVLVIDEFADLIMTAGKEIELPIGRLAQLARAVGIHLIIATQRPSVKIITGLIKANFPARIAFRVTSNVDSRTILDTKGADQLIGKGDMLLASGSD
ncbi:MAG: DNA translocase FtsK, partial [Saprospiraceae bacterium]|nr:DNA translocase FtsK [Saprospiraceae bacterium]